MSARAGNLLVWGGDITYTSLYHDNGKISVVGEKTTGNYYIAKNYEPFTTLTIDFVTSIDIVGFKGVFPMPAFMFHWICNEYTLQTLNTAVDISLFAASFVITGAEIATAKITWKIYVGVAEILYSTGSLCLKLNSNTRGIIGKTAAGAVFLDYWDKAGIVFDVKTLSESVIDEHFPLLLSLEKSWTQLEEENPNLKQLIGAVEYDKIKTLIKKTK